MQTGADALTGRVIAHYQILEKLGEGGMGVVYKARDTHLDRFVAIKVLPPEKVLDPDSKRRFVQEARAASALNHPGIVTVHDVFAEGGQDVIVMELLSGKPLDRLIPRRGVPLGDALKYALQIADALATAHAGGIIHRDLKPANIMVDDHGTVKVLDFGLAKLAGPPESDGASTMSAPVRTAEGTIVGTAAYMSPEQAEGKPVDARSDVFSFGAVLYEMITGRPAFRGDTSISTLAAVINQNPQPAGPDVPRDLERIIFRCLRKDPDRRFHHMIDLKVALADLKEESDSGALAVAPPPYRRRRWLPAAALAAAATALIAAFLLWKKAPANPAEGAERTRVTFDSGLTTDPGLSPDGKLVVYASDRAGQGNLDIWIQNLASGETTRLTKDPADEHAPSFSPDGSRIVFRSDKQGGGIFTVSALGGGEPRLVATGGQAPRYSPDGSLIAYHTGGVAQLVGGLGSELRVVASSGGQPRRVETGVKEAWNPLWTGDGEHLVFVGGDGVDNTDWWVVPIAGGSAVSTGALDALRRAGFKVGGDDVPVSPPDAWLDDSIIFSGQIGNARNLWRLRISSTRWKAIEPPERVTSGTSIETAPTVAAIAERGTPGVRLAFASLVSTLNVYDLPVDANRGTLMASEPRRVTSSAYDAQSSLSADGRRLAFVSTRSGSADIWLRDLESGKETALTSTSADEFGPEISPDGNTVGYQLIENGRWDFFLLPIGRDGQPGVAERVCEDCARVWDLSSDGKHFVFGFDSVSKSMSLVLYDLVSRRKTALVKAPDRNLARARFSPDDRWISFVQHVPGAGRSRVYVIPFAEETVSSPDQWIAVTDDRSYYDKAVWSPDGNLLYFTSDRDGFRCIWAQRLDPKTKRPVGSPFEIYHSHSARRSLLNANIIPLELHVTPGRLLFHLGEITGNIWMVEWKTP